jgi:hypothetical protein
VKEMNGTNNSGKKGGTNTNNQELALEQIGANDGSTRCTNYGQTGYATIAHIPGKTKSQLEKEEQENNKPW